MTATHAINEFTVSCRDRAYETFFRILAERFPHTTDGHLRSTAAEAVPAVEADLSAAALMSARDTIAKVAERLEETAKRTGDKAHLGTAAGVRLACLRLIELADKAGVQPERRES